MAGTHGDGSTDHQSKNRANAVDFRWMAQKETRKRQKERGAEAPLWYYQLLAA
jgi:hypothetical protein